MIRNKIRIKNDVKIAESCLVCAVLCLLPTPLNTNTSNYAVFRRRRRRCCRRLFKRVMNNNNNRKTWPLLIS